MPRKSAQSYETCNSIFAKRLTDAMKAHGENQTSLAEKITEKYVTIQRQTISLYMNGQSRPDTERLTAIAKVLEVSTDWLLGLSEVESINGEMSQVCNYLGLSEEAVQALVQLKDSPTGYMSAVADYILVCSRFFEETIKYLSSCAWGSIKDTCVGYVPPSNEEIANFKANFKKEFVNTGIPEDFVDSYVDSHLASQIATPILNLGEEYHESIMFSKVIKSLTRLYDDFKEVCAGDKDFADAVVRDYVDSFLPQEGQIRIPRRKE